MDNTTMVPNSKLTTVQAVFSMHELIESIILALPTEDIILTTRLNQIFHSVVTASHAINKSLREEAIDYRRGLNTYPYSANKRNCFVRLFTA
jgi:hypothetical protein